MLELEFLLPSLLFLLSFIFLFFIYVSTKSSSSPYSKLPRSYPLIGPSLAVIANRNRLHEYIAECLTSIPNATYVLLHPLGLRHIFTANPANVEHILKTQFYTYPKGNLIATALSDFLGSGIFNADGDNWKFQRQISSHEFRTTSLRNFMDNVVETELSNRLLPILLAAANNKSVLDLEDILQRFTFDNICEIAFGYDPKCLLPSLPLTEFAAAFEDAAMISFNRFLSAVPAVWKLKRALNIGSEKRLKQAVAQVRKFAQSIVRRKKEELKEKPAIETPDLLSRILSSGQSDDTFVTDMVISFILAGRDTTSAALTWFFWLVSNNANVEDELLKEIREKSESLVYDEVKNMVYTQASLCESMRLYPPVPSDSKEAASDDVLPDGTIVKKGMIVTFHIYSMGRMKSSWGEDYLEFKPERWLKRDELSKKRSFGARDAYMYPVFLGGPRICLGKEMAFLQMKRVVAEVLSRFRIVPVIDKGCQPVLTFSFTSKMEGGFPVRIEHRE